MLGPSFTRLFESGGATFKMNKKARYLCLRMEGQDVGVLLSSNSQYLGGC